MKIVEMDGYAANPGDISWEPWKYIVSPDGTKCEFTVYDRTPAELVVERAKDADIVITNKVVFSDEVMAQLPKLKYIGVLATGYNVVDIEAACKRGITVTNIPAYSTMSVAQTAIAHLLNITNNVAGHSASVHNGDWKNGPDFSYSVSPLTEVAGLTFGIVGLGNTGKATAKVANALGMNIIAFTSKAQKDLPDYIKKVETIEDLFKESDVLSLHCPLTPSTHHIVNKEHLALMKPSAIIINTGRGPLVDEEALAEALREGKLRAAGVDVLTEEPPRNDSPLLHIDNCHITPHVAWATFEARKRLMDIAVKNIEAFIKGEPQNVIKA